MLNVRVRYGFTLAEIMVALVVMLVVSGAVHKLLVSTQRLTMRQAEQVRLQSSLRTASLVVTNELRELSTLAGGSVHQNDILGITPAAVTYRAMRGVGFVCQTPAATEIRLRRAGFTGHRDPQAGRDTLYVFVGETPGSDSAAGWLPLAITGVSAGTCPGSLGSAVTLTVPATQTLTGLEVGTPIRVAETMELKLYQSEGLSWLGARSASAGEAIQPVAGPFAGGQGLGLEYLDGWGTSTTDLPSIKSIRVTLRGQIEGSGLEEALISQVTLQNALRP